MINDDLHYEFAPTGGGDETGFNDPVTTSFKGDIPYFLARESIQNIIDNKLPNSLPARAEFKLFKIHASELVGVSELRQIIQKCRDRFKNNINSTKFYDEIIKKIDEDALIPILKISDFNTAGLSGDDHDVSGNYYNFCKAVGASSKEGGLGGSFGLGKGAYFSASAFKMIFFSSVYDERNVVFQGKLRLSSFDDDGITKQGNGSFGYKEQKPVRDKDRIPALFIRGEQGTDIYVVDFKGGQYWESDIIKSVLNNFWPAISENYLEVKVGDQLIDKNTLESLLNKYYDSFTDTVLQDTKEFPCPVPYYLAFKKGKLFEEKLPALGDVKLYLYFNPSFNNKIAFFRRTGMVVEKRPYASIKRLAGVFACFDIKGSEVLRAMENPQHNEWKKINAVTSKYEKDAEKADKEIKEFIKKCINSLEMSDSDYQEIPGLDKYLSIKGEDDLAGFSRGEENLGSLVDEETAVEQQEEKPREAVPVFKQIYVNKKVSTTGTEGEEDSTPGGGGEGGSGGQNNEGKQGEGEKKIFTNLRFRTFAKRNNDGKYDHYILLKGPANKELDIDIKAGTDSSFDTIDIKNVTSLGKEIRHDRGGIHGIILDNKGFARLIVDFGTREKYSLNVTAYENS